MKDTNTQILQDIEFDVSLLSAKTDPKLDIIIETLKAIKEDVKTIKKALIDYGYIK